MSRRHVLAPQQEPSWRFEADGFAARIRRRWPRARIASPDPTGPPELLLHALIPANPPSRGWGIALDAAGWAVILDPADPATAAEFAVWYAGQLPAFDPPVHITVDDWAGVITLHPAIRHHELLAELDPLPVPRPDPTAVGQVAAEILDRIVGSDEYRRLADDARRTLKTWATFGGLPLIARLDLTTDARPLLREALRVLALRAAVSRITGCDDTAATLVVPAPIDDAIRVVLAQSTRCTRISQRLAIRLVRQFTHWEHFGWHRRDYSHRCYLAAGWGEPNERYWLDADETARRLQVLTGRYADIGIRRGGAQHNLPFPHLPDPSVIAAD